MGLQILPAVAGLPVSIVNLSGLRVADDADFQFLDAFQMRFLFLNRITKLMESRRTGRCLLIQLCIIPDPVLLQEQQGLRDLLDVIDLRPAFIALALSLLHLPIDVDEQIEAPVGSSVPLGCALLFGAASRFSLFRIRHHFSGNAFPDILLAVSFPKGGQSYKPLLPRAADGDVLALLDFIAGGPQLLQKILQILRLRRKQLIDFLPKHLPKRRPPLCIIHVRIPIVPFGGLPRLDDRQRMLKTNGIADPLQGQGDEPGIPKLPVTA